MDTNKQTESIWVRGVAASIQAMAMPTLQNLKDMLLKFGYVITKKAN